MHIILLNGLAGSGKDTLAKKYVQEGYIHLKFATKLYQITAKTLGKSEEYLFSRENKDQLKILGKTPRQWLIEVATEIKKDNKCYFAEHVISQLEKGKNYIISDLGFPEELEVIKTYCERKSVTYEVIRMEKRYLGDIPDSRMLL